MAVSVDPSKTLLQLPMSGTWANRPSSASDGQLYFANDLGVGGSVFQYSVALARWRALNGSVTLKDLGAPQSGITNSETIVFQTLIPAGAVQTNDTVRVWLTVTKNGTTDVGNLIVRVGLAGTTADTAITGLSPFAMLAASGLSGGGIFDIKLLSATSAQKVGANVINSHSYTASGSTAAAAATAITDASANALWVSVSVASAGATNTVGVTSGQIQLVTP